MAREGKRRDELPGHRDGDVGFRNSSSEALLFEENLVRWGSVLQVSSESSAQRLGAQGCATDLQNDEGRQGSGLCFVQLCAVALLAGAQHVSGLRLKLRMQHVKVPLILRNPYGKLRNNPYQNLDSNPTTSGSEARTSPVSAGGSRYCFEDDTRGLRAISGFPHTYRRVFRKSPAHLPGPLTVLALGSARFAQGVACCSRDVRSRAETRFAYGVPFIVIDLEPRTTEAI